MNRLLRIKPSRYLLMYFGLIVISLFLFAQWSNIVPKPLIIYGLFFVVLILVIGYLFWIYLILYGFNHLDNKNNISNEFKKTQGLILALLLTICLHLFMFFKSPPSVDNSGLTTLAYFFTSISIIYCYFKIVGVLTIKFNFYDKKPKPTLQNYFVTFFLLQFFPFGILMMHSHLRLILADNSVDSAAKG